MNDLNVAIWNGWRTTTYKYPKTNLGYGDNDDGMSELYINICESNNTV